MERLIAQRQRGCFIFLTRVDCMSTSPWISTPIGRAQLGLWCLLLSSCLSSPGRAGLGLPSVLLRRLWALFLLCSSLHCNCVDNELIKSNHRSNIKPILSIKMNLSPLALLLLLDAASPSLVSAKVSSLFIVVCTLCECRVYIV